MGSAESVESHQISDLQKDLRGSTVGARKSAFDKLLQLSTNASNAKVNCISAFIDPS